MSNLADAGAAKQIDTALRIGNVVLDSPRIFSQLRQDLNDDWFPDPLQYRDMLNGEQNHVTQAILANVEQNHGQYVASRRSVYNLPKSNFTLRYALEVSLADRAMYHALVALLIPLYDPLIPWNSFSYRWNLSLHGKTLFKRSVAAWKDFVGATKSALQPGMSLVSADISNYYENIDLKQLKDTLESLIPLLKASPEVKSSVWSNIALLFQWLKNWSLDANRGLPQNRDASSFLANLYLYPVDAAMRRAGYAETYFRYMDDIRLVCSNRFEARRALKTLSLALRDVGLALNAKKTDICDGPNFEKLNDYLPEVSPEIQHLDALWNTRKRDVILWSADELKNVTIDLIRTDRMDSKDFKFCMLRLEALALCTEFVVPPEFFKDVTPAILKGLVDSPSSTEYFSRYLQAVPMAETDLTFVANHLVDHARAIYNWQNYHLWSVLTRKKYITKALTAHACKIVSSADDTPTKAGASIYLGSGGDLDERRLVAERFRSLESFIGQRCALVATHELPFKPHIKEHIKPFVRSDLIGVYKNLQSRKGNYLAPLKKKPLSSFMDREREYD